MLFILGIAAMPVSAHFTMGNHVPTYPFRTRNFDPHVDGLVGYVFPGSGLISPVSTLPSPPAFANAPGWYYGPPTYPGYQSPWPYYQTTNVPTGIWQPWPVQGPMGWYQLDANNYAPFGAILTSTIKAGTPFTTMWKANKWASDNPTIESLEIEHAVKGDLILAFNVTRGLKVTWDTQTPALANAYAVNFTMAEIMIPPEFSVGLSRRNVVASFTNNYDNIGISTRNREDVGYGPYWRRLRVYTDSSVFAGGFCSDQDSTDKMDDLPDPMISPNGPFQFSPWKTFGNITFSLRTDRNGNYPDEWYYIRINDMTAPTIAGAYQFKFRRLYSYELGSVYFPYQNYPVVLVKGEVDPAIITGTIRYGGWNTTLYGQPVTLPGRVRAVGIADDPYTGKSTGRPVEARGFFDAAWCGHYEVEGVAPGVYDIYASAAGYPEIKIASNVKILKGQSYHIDGYLVPGVQIKGTVFSKCGTGEVPWFQTLTERDIKIEIYRSLEDAQSMTPGGSTSKAVTWSPIDYGTSSWGAYSFYWTVGGFTEGGTRRTHGVGPPPSPGWRVDGTGGNAKFDFQFGREGYYGAPADLDGHVPSLDWTSSSRYGSTWVSGIGAGTYYVRAWLYGYVQTEADGVTFMPVTFTVPSVEWPGNVWIPFDLRLSNVLAKTVHFHDVPGTLMESSIGWGWSARMLTGTAPWQANLMTKFLDDQQPPTAPYGYYRFLAVELVGTGSSNYKNQAGEPIFAWKTDPVGVGNTSYTIRTRGFMEMSLFYGWGRNYGIPAGLYTAKAYMWGYVEQVFEKVNLGLCGSETLISDHLYRGAKFNITVYSKDWQHPTADKTWSFPYMPIWVQILKDGKLVQFDPFSNLVMPITMQGWGNTSVAVWPYMWNNPWALRATNDAVAQVFGPDAYTSVYGGSYYERYFGPSAWHREANGRHFRYYDGSENYQWMYYLWSWSGTPAGQSICIGSYPLSFETGIYDFKALTYGYVQKKPVVVGATKGNATSDILIKLTQGAELELTIKFKHEGVFEQYGIPFDAHMRVRVLNDKNVLVGEYLTSDWWWQPQYEWSTPANTGSLRYRWNLVRTVPATNIGNPRADPAANLDVSGHRGWWRLNYIPQGTTTVKVVIAGLPDLYNYAGGYSCDPCGATGDFGYNNPIPAPYGIDAYPNYQGGWKIQVHVVPVFDYYPGHYYNPVEVSTPLDPLGTAPSDPLGFEAMLTGELTYTADMKPIYINHLGPYELRYDVVVPGTHLGGESSLIFELDRRGLVTGNVYGYTWCDDWRSTAWTTVQFTAADGTVFSHYTFDGWFAAWLNAGPYTASVIYWTPAKQEGYKVQTMPYHVSDGALGAFNVYLERSGIPIPEFPAAATMLAFVLAASLVILRRRKK